MFFGLYLIIRLVAIFFSIIRDSHALAKSRGTSLILRGAIALFFITFILPFIVFSYQGITQLSFTSNWYLLNENPLGQFTLMLPNTMMILVSEDVSVWFKLIIILLLLGINVFMTGIQYMISWTTTEVTWKHGYSFHKSAQTRKDFEAKHDKPKLSLGWDEKEEKGLKALDRVPLRIYRRNTEVIEYFVISMGVVFLILILILGLSPLLLFYMILTFPFLLLFTIMIIWAIVFQGEGFKAINPKITHKLVKSRPRGDPYCEDVYEFKEEE